MHKSLKDPRLINSSLPQMSGTLRRKKDKTRLVLFFHRVQIENTLKSIKAVKELELTDLNVSKSLLSSNRTYILLLPQECSHSRPVM